MTAQQKMAWFQFWVVTAASALVLILWPFIGRGASGAIGVTGLLGFNFLFMAGKNARTWDEREAQISTRANLIAYTVFWFYFVAACEIPWAVHRHLGQSSISVEYLPAMLVFGYMGFSLLQAAAILAQYRGLSADDSIGN